MDVLAGIIFVICCVAGIIFFAGDFRHFNEIKAQCEKQGYIQNSTTRIVCNLEKN